MKHHIALKFIAVVLCTASLLGAVCSGLCIFVMTESGLYEKTVEEVRQERLEATAIPFAQEIAARYASINLGSCPEQLVNTRSGNWYYNTFSDGYYGYKLMDADGNVLESMDYTGTDTANAVTYTFPATGTYMQLFSLTPEPENLPDLEVEYTSLDGETYIYDAIANGETADVYNLSVTYGNGSSEGMSSDEPIGYLYYNEEGEVVFQTFTPGMINVADGTAVTGITFRDKNSETVYEASSPEPIGTFFYDSNGCAFFVSNVLSGGTDEPTYASVAPVAWGVAKEVVNIRVSPSMTSSTDGYLQVGDEVGILVLETEDGVEWGYIEEDAGEGWIPMDHIALLEHPTQETETEATAPQITEVTTESVGGQINTYVNVHANPSLDSPVVSHLDVGNTVEILARETVDGMEWGWVAEAGWIPLEQVTLTPAAAASTDQEDQAASAVTGVTEEALNIYRNPNPNDEVVDRLDAGATVTILLQETVKDARWGQIDLGWILLDSVTLFPDTDGGIAAASDTNAEGTAAYSAEPAAASEAPTVPEIAAATEAAPTSNASDSATEPATPERAAIQGNVFSYSYYDQEAGKNMYAEYINADMPEYTVELTLAPGALRYDSFYDVLELVWAYRSDLFFVLGVSVLLFAILFVYLCCAAGKKPHSDEVHAAGLNCIPLDAYLGGGAVAVTCLFVVIAEGGSYLLRQDLLVGCAFAVSIAYLACLICVGFCFACAAQFKTPGGYWWRNTLCGHCFRLLVRMLGWFFGFCANALFPFLRKSFGWLCHAAMALLLFGKKALIALYELVKKLWLWFWALVKKWMGKLGKTLNRFFSLLPMTWQWLLAGCILIFVSMTLRSDPGFLSVACWFFCFGLVLYGAHCFGTLSESAKRMGKGDLDTKVDDKLLVGCFKDFAGDLNALADVAVVAAQKQLKSERMKTELITNVSHDIKTPLTSIINYVDLLQKPHSDAEQKQYLEVLDRQSQRLKKLIGDLIEMSKASTGNMTVDIIRVDAIESVNQALGEFADKLDKAQLVPVFRRPDTPVTMMADGRLVWRVLSNLLSNAVKYALPGTRLYIDLMELEGKVIISLKNISREELNVDAEELMERFVRGDDSRNTEGSGLGLNIAKSLMELQKGQLQLLVDGDLFKVTLIFPGV